jgi:hypothetical protein
MLITASSCGLKCSTSNAAIAYTLVIFSSLSGSTLARLATKVENVHPRHESRSRTLVAAPFTRPPISGQQCPAGIAPPHSQSLHNSPRSQLLLKMAQDPTPTSFSPSQDARRRNAEQRAYMLRADPLITEVEPGRVFCSLCQKWVQLRQDSSYCAYPWLQHRGKCLARL